MNVFNSFYRTPGKKSLTIDKLDSDNYSTVSVVDSNGESILFS
ncbi:hypothetical protein bcere0017_22580 [Bacillus cereus Rock1-3]|nr:hypothetical protein bcere0017_22580 [Bacillus cereus Rock1-3]